MGHFINKVCFNKSYCIKVSFYIESTWIPDPCFHACCTQRLYKAILVQCTPRCVITLTKIFVLHAFLIRTWLGVTTGWVISAGSVATLQCASTGPHFGWLLVTVAVDNCRNDVRNIGRCQRAYFRITCFLHSFWIRGSLVVSFRGALVLPFDVVASGVWPFCWFFGGSVFFSLECGGIMFAVTHSPPLPLLNHVYCTCATIPISAQVPLLVSYPMMDCLQLLTFTTLTRFKGI